MISRLRSWCIAESKTDAEEDKMEIDEPAAEEAPSAAPEEVIQSTDKSDPADKPNSLDKSAPAEPSAEVAITATEVTPDLEEPIVKDTVVNEPAVNEPIVKDTVVKEPAVKEPSEPVALPAEKTAEEIVPVPEIQATEVEPSEQAPASNAVPKIEEPPSATTSQQAQGIPVPDVSAPNGVSKPDVSSVVSSESKGGLSVSSLPKPCHLISLLGHTGIKHGKKPWSSHQKFTCNVKTCSERVEFQEIMILTGVLIDHIIQHCTLGMLSSGFQHCSPPRTQHYSMLKSQVR